MKIKILSDIHLENYYPCCRFPYIGNGDILILAGDILNAKHFKTNGFLKELYLNFIQECSNNYEHVLYVCGNHEFYGYNYEGTYNKIQEHLPDNFSLLENKIVTLNGWNFIGFTFWTDFCNQHPLELFDAGRLMNDYKAIRIGKNYRKLCPEDTLSLNLKSRNYLKEQLDNLTDNVFVISHHAPSFRSVPEEFKNGFCNGAYCNSLDEFIMDHQQIKFWAHGHTHNAQDYMIEQCRVLCNPVGYQGQNTNFNPNLILEI